MSKEITVYEPSKLWTGPTPFCSGCMYGIINKAVLDTIGDVGLDPRKVIFSTCPGCVVMQIFATNLNFVQSGLGRSPAVCTGIKRARPDHFVFGLDGDGADADIGLGDLIHCAGRGENITIIMVNNSVFANTGGQKSATTLIGQRTSTTQKGRDPELDGYPIRVPELLATLDGTKLAARVAVYDPKHLREAKKILRKAFENQINNVGFSFVEFLSNCPNSWRMDPMDTLSYIPDVTEKTFPVGVFKDVSEAPGGDKDEK